MLNDLLAALNDCVCAYDVQTQSYLFISPSVHTVLEYSAKDLQQNPNFWNDIIDLRDREEILSAEHKLYMGGGAGRAGRGGAGGGGGGGGRRGGRQGAD